VTDPSGAAVPGAVIEATNLGTNRKSSSTTTQVGTYFLGSLPVGQCKVTARQTGFKQFVAQTIIVFTATTTSLDISLHLGEVTQQVTVEAEAAPLIRTSDAEASTVVERKAVIDLPLSLGGVSQIAASGRRQIENFAYAQTGAANEAWWYSGGNAFSSGFAGTSSFGTTNNGITPAFLLELAVH